jgi:O-antigen ligase
MDYIEKTTVEGFFSQIPSVLAKVSFLIYFFFVFFGTSLPFQDYSITSVDDIATSNPINQIVFSSLYLLSFPGLLTRKNRILELIKTEKFFSLFLAWSFLTIFWSDAMFVSFKRWLQFFGSGIILLSAILNFRSIDECIGYVKIILSIYIPITLLSIILGPGVGQWGWKGLTLQKNMLGQHVLMSLIIWSIAIARDNGLKKKTYALIFWCISLILLIGSRSVTCILTAMALFLIVGAFKAQKVIFEPIIGRFFSLVFIFLFWFSVAAIVILNPDLLASMFAAFGKDITLTGRVELWGSIFSYTQNHLFIGCGFGGFWVVGSSTLNSLYDEYTWFPNEAHLGYLDILNETGVIGLLFFIFMVSFYFVNNLKIDKANPWKWLLITVLILNLSESTLIIPNSVTGASVVFSYLALYVMLLKTNSGDQITSRENALY